MSINIDIESGKSKRLLTSGKYCPEDIVITTESGTAFTLTATTTPGATVTATLGDLAATAVADASGMAMLTLPEAGTWSVVATYNGKTSDTKTVSVVDSYAVVLTFFSATINVTVPSGATVYLKKGGTTLQTKTSTGTVAFTVTETGTYTVEATNGSQTTSGTVSVTSATSYALTLSFVSSTLNSNEWDVIRSVSDAGEGANYWSVGDRKAVVLNGTVGALTLSNVTTYAFILGFNHNSSVEGSGRIHFQLGKTALSGGKDVAFLDSKYNSSVSETGYFSMNSSSTNSGGWSSSQMRTKICGTSLSSYSGTIIAVIPEALRAVLKSVTKYTNNKGESSAEEAITATTDYFFLLSEYEVFGSCTYANDNEASKQKQYDYYSAGNGKVKYNQSNITNAVRWWLRSPRVAFSSRFVSVSADGTSTYGTANNSLGFAPGFCV